MNTIIAYVDDAEHTQRLLQATVLAPQYLQAHWVLVACAPRVTHRVSKFASNRSRESWRSKWADRLFQACVPALQAHDLQVSTVLARAPLPELLQQLQAQYGTNAVLLDWRRPKELDRPASGWRHTMGSLAALSTLLLSDVLVAA